MDTSNPYRTSQCWNSPYLTETGCFVPLSARARWIDGRTVVIARKVKKAMIVEAPELKAKSFRPVGAALGADFQISGQGVNGIGIQSVAMG